ncbi:CARDB domain-containing protein [Haloarchaeobius iranensis]|uniref:PGF-pre-PGF domain-containing protein n=1 Tax=Haloarchaeobius iranensis TaxID=996166 RepID=A0A1G9XXJ9_9EURY|nr:CARDB domain-containing protein [Haloarchaeobius iranensis]SDN01507.1 PGF-pre-PGF domain-containing protein [Haloarchaeobius iranensis]
MRSTTKLLLTGLATITLALALLQGTGAVELTEGDDIGQSIVLEPHPGPNGQYAYYDENDELAVDLSASNPNVAGDGPNDDAVTGVPEVFTVTNEGDSTARVWIESGHPLATFTARGEPVEGADQAVHLAPNESLAVGLRVVTTDEVLPDVVVDSFEVNAVVADDGGERDPGTEPRDSDDGDGSAAVEPSDGTTTTVTSPAPNRRGVTVLGGDDRVSVGLDGMHVAGANVTLDRVAFAATGSVVEFDAAGQPGPFGGLPGLGADHVRADGYVQLDRERVPDAVGDATVYVSVDRDYLDWRGAHPEDVTVFRLGSDGWTELETEVVKRGERVHYAANASRLSSVVVATRLPAIEVTDARVETAHVAPGEAATVTAELTNAGRVDGERTVPVTVDGEHVRSLTVELLANESTTVSERLSFDEPGEYELAVGGVDAGTVVVTAESPATNDGPPEQDGPGTPASDDEDSDPARPSPPQVDTDAAEPALAVLAVVIGATLLVAVVLGRRLVTP